MSIARAQRGSGRFRMTSPDRKNAHAPHDPTDLLFYAALITLPVDGTVFGVQMPYYSPISPVFFALYALCNARRLPALFLRLTRPMHPRTDTASAGSTISTVSLSGSPMFPHTLALLAALCAVSVFGWVTVGLDATYAPRTLMAVGFAFATLASFGIAWSVKRLPMRMAVTVLVAAYAAAFLFGVFTWAVEPAHLTALSETLGGWSSGLAGKTVAEATSVLSGARNRLSGVFLRQYFVTRPQFLFAEPSYIGMHLFGVLLPVYWLSRDRRLPSLIAVFAGGSVLMGSGVRIVLDTAVACVLWVAADVPWGRVWRDMRLRCATFGAAAVACTSGAAVFVTQPRLRALAADGLFAGDASMSARLFRSVAPLDAGLHDVPHLLFGFGAGSVAEAMRRRYADALAWYAAHGGVMTAEIGELRNPLGPTGNLAGNAFTMNAYVSFVTEFGLVAFVAALALLLWHMTRNRAWSRRTVCWLLLLAYLYVQFEAYAFPAFALFVWATARERDGRPNTHAASMTDGMAD
ncbi:hypothetical protein JS531_02495 [Bifidobacterium sp. CP2]|uniref:hypothetical protein n=1 Tax=Bifidobacterium sp. CP2 TaxID=2809025 RepID=UPI001BDC23CA|nr:hypothetical protein [Bifidobacterium sp. CP2]MBT1180859.1 hypothetical protein [Bifidobacterium sp. CP2]